MQNVIEAEFPRASFHRGPLPSAAQDRKLLIIGNVSATNTRLSRAFGDRGLDAWILPASSAAGVLDCFDLALNRTDVAPTLDGPEAGFWTLAGSCGAVNRMFNTPLSLLAAHDKLMTARMLGSARLPHPLTEHALYPSSPVELEPPYVVKPRHGSWGADVFRCVDRSGLIQTLNSLVSRPWFQRHGAIVQELLPHGDHDLRVIVAGSSVVGAVERLAAPGEWRTNVALGGVRRPIVPSDEAAGLAVAAVRALGLDFAGVDLVTDRDGNHVVLEVNGAVDFTNHYSPDPYSAAVSALLGVAATRYLDPAPPMPDERASAARTTLASPIDPLRALGLCPADGALTVRAHPGRLTVTGSP